LFLKKYFEKHSLQAILIIGAWEILEPLHNSARLGIISNGSGEVQKPGLNKTDIARFFSHEFFIRDIDRLFHKSQKRVLNARIAGISRIQNVPDGERH
jgi:FMN phosphatase YigB (HAD superfamily)